MVSFIIVLLAGCNLMDPQLVLFDQSVEEDSGDTGMVDTGHTGETGDSDTSPDSDSDTDSNPDTHTGDSVETGETGETGTETGETGIDTGETGETGDTADSADTGETEETGETGDTSDTAVDTADTGSIDTGDTGDTSVPVDTADTSTSIDTADTGTVETGDTAVDTSTPIDTAIDTSVVTVDNDGDSYAEDVDCDDTDASVNPGAIEACNGVDDNCDGTVDESGATGETSWYADDDGDTYGDAAVTVVACSAPLGYVADATDCDDDHAEVNLAEAESVYTVWDDNCDGTTYTGRTLATGVVATSESFVADNADAQFESGVSASWDTHSYFLGYTSVDLATSVGVFTNTLVGSYDGLTFFGTGGVASQDDECMVYVGMLETTAGDTVHAGDRVAVVFDMDSDAASRYGIGVYLGDVTNSATWVSLTVGSSITAATDLFEVATGTSGMADPNVIICAGGVEYDDEVRFTHFAVVKY